MTEPIDPGPAPSSLVVRPQGEGFYARLSPRPMPSALQVLGATLGFGGLGLALAFGFAADPLLRAEIAGAILLFGLLISVFAQLSGWFPVEIMVDDTVVNWNGERIPMSAVRDCVARQGSVELLGEAGRSLGAVHDIQPEAARWLAAAIQASLPVRPVPLKPDPLKLSD